MFSVKRPLRFLIHKLGLDQEQIMAVADALSDFRMEKDLADVDRRRAKKVLVGALKGEEFDEEVAAEGVKAQVEANQRLQEAFVDSLKRVHGVLTTDQREKLAFLLGSLDIEV